MSLKQIRCIPQSEHQEYAYVDGEFGVFAKFYGPDANRNMRLFTLAEEMLGALERAYSEYESKELRDYVGDVIRRAKGEQNV